MNIAFAGFRHSHILGLYNTASDADFVNITGCYERDEETALKIQKDNNIHFNYNSYSELLNDENVDVVAIGDYYGIRGQMIIDALKHGKHIICDKPLCTDLSELEEIEKLCREKNLKICCMLDLRYMPQIEKVKKIIASNELGKIRIASFTGQHCLDYENRPKWYFESGKHGGTINDIAIHGIDLLRFITGKNLTKINCAKQWNAFAFKTPDFKDSAQFMIEMEDMAVMADVSYAAPKFNGLLPTYWDFTLWFEKGMIRFNLKDSSLHIFQSEEKIIDCENTSIGYLKDFHDELNGKATIMNCEDILKSQRQVLEIQKFADCM